MSMTDERSLRHSSSGRCSDDTLDTKIKIGHLFGILFLFINPFIALFFQALLSLRIRVPKFILILFASLSFATFFFNRQYGIYWYPGASDDVPIYLNLYLSNRGQTFSVLWSRFIESPNGNEILWFLPWSIILNEFGAREEVFIFLHYLLNFVALFISMRLLSRRYWIAFVLVYFFLTPITLVGMAHIWRQQLAFSIFLSGIALKYQRRSLVGILLIYISPFMHVSAAFFVLSYWVFLLFRRNHIFDRKTRFALLLGVLMVLIPICTKMTVIALNALGMERIMSYYQGDDGSTIRVYLLMIVYALPMLAIFFWFRTDDINRIFLLLNFAVFSLVLALPSANGIYDRLLMFSLPLMGIFFYRCLIENFSQKLQMPALIIIFFIGTYRLYVPTRNGAGVMNFVANGQSFDPFMGLGKVLLYWGL